jgi:hypothetical protein
MAILKLPGKPADNQIMPPQKANDPAPRAKRPARSIAQRATVHIFDRTFKQLLHLSNKAVISFINGLFRTKHPLDSNIEPLNTETISKDLRLRTSDTLLRINGLTYHIEVQTSFDVEMTIRVFEYGFAYGVREKTFDQEVRTILFPQSRIIYLTGTAKTPAKQTLRLQFPDGFCYDYEVKTFNPLDHSVKELEKKGMAILLPFYILKMREEIAKADSKERRKLPAKMRKLLDNVDEAVKNCREKGQIDDQDALDIMRDLDRLYTELYGGYEELAGEDTMVKEKIVRYSTQLVEEARKQCKLEMAKNLLALGDSPEKVVQASGLPLRTIKALLETA